MKRLLLVIIAAAFVLTGCVTTQPKIEVNEAPNQQQEARLTQIDIAKILAVAVNDIKKQGCKAMFLSERGAYIWCKYKDGVVKLYDMELLLKKYQEAKQKAVEDQEKEKTGVN